MFAHDLCAVAIAPLRSVPKDKWKLDEISFVLRKGLQFCMLGSVDINGRTINNWSRLRSSLKAEIVKSHIAELHEANETLHVDGQASSEQIADSILRQLGSGSLGEATDQLPAEIVQFQDDSKKQKAQQINKAPHCDSQNQKNKSK